MDKLEIAVRIFMQHYEPVATIAQSDEQLTTLEVWERFNSLFHDDKVTVELIYEMMNQAGYVYDMVFDEFKWLLKITEK